MLGPMDEFPIHQLPQPIAWPGSSDRNFYDRSYFNAHDRSGDIFAIFGAEMVYFYQHRELHGTAGRQHLTHLVILMLINLGLALIYLASIRRRRAT